MAGFALVTGSSTGGMGYFFCVSLAKRGYHVFATARSKEAMKGLEEYPNIEFLTLDVTSDESLQSCYETVKAKTDRLNVLINNAGIGGSAPLLELPLDQARMMFEVNVWGTLAMIQKFGPMLIESGQAGFHRSCNIGSVQGIRTTPFYSAYGGAKSAIHAMSDALRLEVEGFGVSVVVAAPGGVKTKIREKIPAGFSKRFQIIYKNWDEINKVKNRTMSNEGYAPVDEFAEHLISVITTPKPPAYVVTGVNSYVFKYLIPYLPTCWVDAMFRKKFGCDLVVQS